MGESICAQDAQVVQCTPGGCSVIHHKHKKETIAYSLVLVEVQLAAPCKRMTMLKMILGRRARCALLGPEMVNNPDSLPTPIGFSSARSRQPANSS